MKAHFVALIASILLMLGTTAKGQCSSISNMISIASVNSGTVVDAWLDEYTYFGVFVEIGNDPVIYTFSVGNNAWNGGSFSENEAGYGVVTWGDYVCEVRCDDADSGGVIVTLTRDTSEYIDIHEYSVSSAGAATEVTARDWCPCAGGPGVRVRAQCTPYACNNVLVCKKLGGLYGTATGWCTWPSED